VTVTVSGPGGTDDQALSWAVVAATIMEYSVYGDNAPPFTYTTYDDAGVDSWLGEQFTLSDTPERAFQAVGVRVYVPAGSAMIGQTGYIGLVRRAVESSGAYVYGAAIPSPGPGGNGSKTAMATPLVEGWNDFYLDTPQAANSGDALVACIALRGYYLFGAGPHEEIESADTNLFLVDAASYQRTFYASDGLGGMGVSSAIDYGLDIIVRET
jgi:hypothetical protein